MTVLPFGEFFTDSGESIPLILADWMCGNPIYFGCFFLGVYGIVLAGYFSLSLSSNSKYPFLGGIRSSAQMISYELAMGLSLLPVFLWVSQPGVDVSALSLVEIVNSQHHATWLLFATCLCTYFSDRFVRRPTVYPLTYLNPKPI